MLHSRISHPGWSGIVLLFLLTAAVCIAGAELGHVLSFEANFATFWPNAGIVLALLHSQKRQRWPIVLAGTLLANVVSDVYLHDQAYVVSFQFWIANSAESLVSVGLLRLLLPANFFLRNVREVLRFILGPCVLGTIVGATLGGLTVHRSFGVEYLEAWQVWWSGDFIGMLVMFPLCLNLVTSQDYSLDGTAEGATSLQGPLDLLQLTLMCVGQAGLTWYIFGVQRQPLAYAVFPGLLWVVLRFDLIGANVGILLTALIVIGQTASGNGMFGVIDDLSRRAFLLQVFLFICSATFLVLAAAVRERRDTGVGLVKSRFTVQHAPCAVFWIDEENQIVYANEQASTLTGYPESALLNRPFILLEPPDLESSFAKTIEQARSGDAASFEERIQTQNNHLLDCEFFINRVEIEEQNLVVAMVIDISARTAARRDLQKVTRRLKAYVELIGMTDGSWSWDMVEERVRFSRRFREMLGYKGGDFERFPDQIDSFFDAIHPKDRDNVQAAIQQHLKDDDDFDAECRLKHQSGRYLWFRIRGNTTRDDKDQPLIMAGSIYEVTDRKETELRLRQSNKDLEQFAYVASHDLQEPLRAVSGFCQLLERRYKEELDEQGQSYITHAVDGAQRMNQLIDALLQFSRVGQQEGAFEVISLDDVVDKAARQLTAIIAETGCQLQRPEPLARVLGNPDMLTLLFQNLISNSIKFRDPERPPVITFRCESDDEFFQIQVCDNGIGIDPTHHKRIFKMFRRLHRRDQISGTGIGLALCAKIVDRHDGRIRVESSGSDGACFVVELPVRVDSDDRS